MEEFRILTGLTMLATFLAFCIFMYLGFRLKRINDACWFAAIATFFLSFHYSNVLTSHGKLRGWSSQTLADMNEAIYLIMVFIFCALFFCAKHVNKERKKQINLEKQ